MLNDSGQGTRMFWPDCFSQQLRCVIDRTANRVFDSGAGAVALPITRLLGRQYDPFEKASNTFLFSRA